MSSRKSRTIFASILLLGLVLVGTGLLINYLIQKPSIQRYLLKQLSNAIGCEIETSKAQISFSNGIVIRAFDLSLKSISGDESARFPEVTATFDIIRLIRGTFLPVTISLYQPKVELISRNWQALSLSPSPGARPHSTVLKKMGIFPAFKIEDAQVFIKDLDVKLKGLNLKMERSDIVSGKILTDLRGIVQYQGKECDLQLEGVLARPKKHAQPSFEMMLYTKKTPLTYIPRLGSLSMLGGRGDVTAKLKGVLGKSVSMHGKIAITEPQFSIANHLGIKNYSFPALALDFEASYADKTFQLSSTKVTGSDFEITTELNLNLGDISNPRLYLKVSSPFMPLASLKTVFPTSVICPWVENHIIPILSEGKGRIDMFSLNGSVEQMKNFDLPENANVLSMGLKLKGVQVLKDSKGIPFEDVSAIISIQNGSLVLSDIKGRFGSSRLNKGSMNLSNIYTQKNMAYNVLVDGLFELTDLEKQNRLNFIPAETRQVFKKFQNPTGNFKANLQIGYKETWDYIKILKGKFDFSNCSFKHVQLRLPVILNTGHLIIDAQGKDLFRADGKWGQSPFHLSGATLDSWKTIKGQIKAQADLNEIMGLLPADRPLPVTFDRTAACQGDFLKQDGGGWSVRGEIKPVGLTARTPSFSVSPAGAKARVSFDVDFHPDERVNLKHSRWRLGNSTLDFSCEYDLKTKKSIRARLKADKFLLKDIGLLIKESKQPAQGSVSCRLNSNINFNNPAMTSVTGKIKTNDLIFYRKDTSLLKSDLDIKFSGKTILINSIRGQAGKNRVRVKGNLTGWDGLKGRMFITSDYIDIPKLLDTVNVFFQGDTDSSPNVFTKQSNVFFDIAVFKGKWDKLNYAPLKAKCNLKAGVFYINKSNARLEHGELNVKGHIKTGSAPDLLFSGILNLKNQSVEDVLDIFGNKRKPLEGRLTTDAVFLLKGRRPSDLISGLSGSANILLEKGNLKKSNLILQILDFFSLQKILDKRPRDLLKGGFRYNSIQTHVVAAKGVLKTDDLLLKSPSFNAAAVGKVDLPAQSLNFDLAAQPFGSTDFLVSKIPIVGYIITGENQSFLVYHFKVQGPLDKPHIKYIPLKNIGKGTVNFFKRLFLTPSRIYKKITRNAWPQPGVSTETGPSKKKTLEAVK